MKLLITLLFLTLFSCSSYAADEKILESNRKKPLIEITHWMRVKHSVYGLRPLVDTSVELGSSFWKIGIAAYSAASRYAQGDDLSKQSVETSRPPTPILESQEGFVRIDTERDAPQLYDNGDDSNRLVYPGDKK
ncbi:MAG: hypothetical protein ACJAZS_000077 [Alteromonas naphthalenivorans]|jgi:hypothetical protein